MAGFKTHITTSTVVGIGYGIGGKLLIDAPLSTCLLSAGLCSVAGILPDLDSDTGRPVREVTALTAAIVPMLLVERLESLGWSHELMVVAAGLTYLVIRFGVVEIFKRYTVHRGMWHSVPAALTVTLLAFLACASSNDMTMRMFKCLAVGLGFMVHLILDEIWSIDFRNGRIKKSFGTAIKFWSKSRWANVSTYGKLIIVAIIAGYDPFFMDQLGAHEHGVPIAARQWLHDLLPDAGFIAAARERFAEPAATNGDAPSGPQWLAPFRSQSASSRAGEENAGGPVAETARFDPTHPGSRFDGSGSLPFDPNSSSGAPAPDGGWFSAEDRPSPAPSAARGTETSGSAELIERPRFLPRGF